MSFTPLDTSKAFPVTSKYNNFLEEYGIDLNSYIDKNIDEATAELTKLLKNTHIVKDCSKHRPNAKPFYGINLYGIDKILVEIEYYYNYKQKNIYSNKYIIFKNIAEQNNYSDIMYTKLNKLLTMEHIKYCFGDLLISKINLLLTYKNSEHYKTINDITLEDITKKKIFTTDEYAKLFNYMSSVIKKYDDNNKIEKVEIYKIDLRKYIGQNIDLVILDLYNQLFDKYRIIDCRYVHAAYGSFFEVCVFCDVDNKVTKIEFKSDKGEGEVTQKGYIKRIKPDYTYLKQFFGFNIDTVLSFISETIDKDIHFYDCRHINNLMGHERDGLMVYCNSNNIVELFEYIDTSLHIVRPIEKPCRFKSLSEISLNTYIGKHIDDVFLELTELLDEKYKVINCKIEDNYSGKNKIKLHCDEKFIVKVITYIDDNDKLKIIKTNNSNYDVAKINVNKYIGQEYIFVETELLEILSTKYNFNPTCKTKYNMTHPEPINDIFIRSEYKFNDIKTNDVKTYANKMNVDKIVTLIEYEQ